MTPELHFGSISPNGILTSVVRDPVKDFGIWWSAEMPAAKTLDDVQKAISPEPLRTPDELQAFYRPELNQVRGVDFLGRIVDDLNGAHGGAGYKAFLMGHTGVGKSTELSRLIQKVDGKFRAFRFQATTDLDPGSFQPFDVLLLMVSEIVSKTGDDVANGGAGRRPPDSMLQELWDWFANEDITQKESTRIAGEVAAGAGVKETSVWAKVLGLFATVKGEIKYASTRETKITEYRLIRIAPLIRVCNKLLIESNRLLREATNKEWLIIGEEFDKQGIAPKLIEDLFVTYANVFKELHTHLICTIPVWLVNSEKATQLPFPANRIFTVPDTPVYDRKFKRFKAGRDAIQAVLQARVDPSLFDKAQMSRLIVASGGNLRDLFALVNEATALAKQRAGKTAKISKPDVDKAINWLRTDYMKRLGESDSDRIRNLTYAIKAERLIEIYKQNPDMLIMDSVTHSLLKSRAVQEFNGARWFGVHPIVVDILSNQGRIRPNAKGKVPGGLE